MSLTLITEYHHIFDDKKPDAVELLSDIPSVYVIGVIALINETLRLRGDGKATQASLIDSLSQQFPEDIRSSVKIRAAQKIQQGYTIFAYPYTVELINRQLQQYNSRIDVPPHDNLYIFRIFKAYLLIVDDIIARDKAVLEDALQQGKKGENILRLMWPHFMLQYEFSNIVDPHIEIVKGAAFVSFLEGHSKFKENAKQYFESLHCSNGQEYIRNLLALVLPSLAKTASRNHLDYHFLIETEKPEPVLESLVINPLEVSRNPKKLLDYLALKEKPVFRISEGKYQVPYLPYFYNTLFTGLIFSFYQNSGIKTLYATTDDPEEQEKAFGNFKGEIGKHFSETILFRNMLTHCFSGKHDCLAFFDDNNEFNPDAYYRRGNHIFLIEFKDYMLNAEVIHSGSYETIRAEIDKKFVQHTEIRNGQTKTRNKGISQLTRNIKKLATNPKLFYEIDLLARNKKLKLRNMHIHPIIVQTSVYFDFPGINHYLDGIIQPLLQDMRGTFKTIKPFTAIYLTYFIERLLMFTDGKLKLEEELAYYHNETRKLKIKAEKSGHPNDWIEGLYPFSFFTSPPYKALVPYRQEEFLTTIEGCWNLRWREGTPTAPLQR